MLSYILNPRHLGNAGLKSADERAAVNSAVQGSGADKLKASMILLHRHVQEQLPRGTCRLVHTVRSLSCFFHRFSRLLFAI